MATPQKTFDDLPEVFTKILKAIDEHRRLSVPYLSLCLLMDYIAYLEEKIEELEKNERNS